MVVWLASVVSAEIFNSVNYRGQPQADLTCMQAKDKDSSGATVVYRNDPSTNCFGFPSIQFDSLPVEGGKPNGMTIDWSLMVDELQMQDDDRLHIHLPGFTGGLNTFGIMGPGINSKVKDMQYAPNFDSEYVEGDEVIPEALRADFGALVGIWGISCGTEANLYMDRAKVDNLRTAEWDPSREMLKVVVKGRRYGPVTTGRHDGYDGPLEAATTKTYATKWTQAADKKVGGKAIPWSDINKDINEKLDDNSQSVRGNQLQAMEYSREGPSAHVTNAAGSTLLVGAIVNGGGGTTVGVTATTPLDATAAKKFIGNFLNDGYVAAPGSRVCGIYIDPTKLHRGQIADGPTNGLGPLPPFGGIGKNWYKLAYIRRYRGERCIGGVTNSLGRSIRPGMTPETCSAQGAKTKTAASLSEFWQVPFDGDTERVVWYQFTTTKQKLPTNGAAAPYGTIQTPTFSFAQAKGKTDGPSRDNCITVSLIPSVTFVSGTSGTQITIGGLKGTGTSDSDNMQLFANDKCTSSYNTLVGSNGAATKAFPPVKGNAAHGTPEDVQNNFRPMGRMVFTKTDGTPVIDEVILLEEKRETCRRPFNTMCAVAVSRCNL